MHRRLSVATLASVAALFCHCGAGQDSAGGEDEFALGLKADDGGCRRESDLCWPSRDIATMAQIIHDELRLFEVPEGQTNDALESLLLSVQDLDHKLNDDERRVVEEIATGSMGRDVKIQRLRQEVLMRLKARYYATFMIPVGQSIEAVSNDRADEAEHSALDDVEPNPEEGIELSLAKLRETLAGNIYATMLIVSGALDIDYTPKVEIGAPNGISREEAVTNIIDHYKVLSAKWGLAAGGVSFIPIAGWVLSIGMDSFATFAIHSRMTFAIGAVYGWDIGKANHLYTMTMFMFSDGEFDQMVDALALTASLPTFIQGIGNYLGFTMSVPLAVKIAVPALVNLVNITIKLGEKLAKRSADSAVKAAVGQILNWASLGMKAFGTAVTDYYVTERIGEHVGVVSRRWLVEIPHGGDEYLRHERDRECFFSALAEVAQVDGDVSPREQKLFQVFLAKFYYKGQRQWYELSSPERVQYSKILGSGTGDGWCLTNAFRDELAPQRLTLIGHLLAMAAIDLTEDEDERALIDERQSGLFAKAKLGDVPVETNRIRYARQVIHATLHPEEIEVPEDFVRSAAAMTPEDLIDFLREEIPEVEADFNCGFAGECP